MELKHTAYMQRALSLAAYGRGQVSPNPCVGCVIVKDGKVIAEGFHERFGGPHAEVVALKKAGPRARGATAYITLEPCTHWGKTPPCTPNLIESGIKHVYVAMLDPNPAVSGKGVRGLKKTKVKVHVGLEKEAAQNLNRAYVKWMKTGLPYVVLKSAMTLDGKTATAKGESKWITHAESRRLVHKMRSEADAILIGASTATMDNPSLTSHGEGRNPIRVVLDPALRTKPSLNLYNDKKAKTLVVTSDRASAKKTSLLEKKGVDILRLGLLSRRFNIKKLLNKLSKMNVSQLFIEGGSETAWEFLHKGLIDEVLFFIAPKLLGGTQSKSPIGGKGFPHLIQSIPVHSLSVTRFGSDILVRGRI